MPRTKVSVVTIGNNFKNRNKHFASILATTHLSRLAKATEIVIKETITDSITRDGSTGRLAGAFFAEQISPLEWGVGRISFLNQEVPYWRHQNYGSLAIGANWQHRVPSGTFSNIPIPTAEASGGKWNVGQRGSIGGGLYSFIPKKPIPAKNYIEKTLAKILPSVSRIIKG